MLVDHGFQLESDFLSDSPVILVLSSPVMMKKGKQVQ